MKRKFSILLAIVFAMAIFNGCGIKENAQNGVDANSTKEKSASHVIATTFAAYDWARNVANGSDGIQISYLVDSSTDMHSYNPSAADIVAYKNADLVIAIGGESEDWLEDIGIDESKILRLSSVVEGKEEEIKEGMQMKEESEEDVELDEHIWLSLKNAKICTNAIKSRFSSLDEENKNIYEENAKDYIEVLDALDKAYEDVVENASCNVLLFGDRFPFRYMIEDYGLDYYAAFTGCSAESEASFDTVTFLAEKVRELGLPAVCHIGNTKIAEQVAKESKTNAMLVEFNSMQSITNQMAESTSYKETMEGNLESLKKALGEVE